MARAYDDDLCRKLLAAHDRGESSLRELASRFGVSYGWAWKISAPRKHSGQPERVRHHPGRKPHAGVEAQQRVLAWVAANPDLTLAEIQSKLASEARVQLSRGRVWYLVRRLGLRLKKALHAQERDTEANRKRREEFLEAIRAIPPKKLIFLDESGVSTQMTRRYARCLGGARIGEGTPAGNWKILTILGATSTRGMIAAMTIEAATDTDIFLAYLDHVLCAKLQPGDVVVMDNLSSHKVDGVRQRIESMGAQVLYLPPYSPYSPDLNLVYTNTKLLSATQVGVQTRAYELYELRGRIDGRAEQDWYQAETDLTASSKQSVVDINVTQEL
jgi:transposase